MTLCGPNPRLSGAISWVNSSYGELMGTFSLPGGPENCLVTWENAEQYHFGEDADVLGTVLPGFRSYNPPMAKTE